MKDILVFSHLRWDFVFQRPQQIMTRLASRYRITFIEEEIPSMDGDDYLLEPVAPNIRVIVPRLNPHRNDLRARRQAVLDQVVADLQLHAFGTWYYTPMAFAHSYHLASRLVVYDCMDELAAFKFAPPALQQYEESLLEAADLVFTGGISLFEAKRLRHPEVHCLPSSIDKAHFSQARTDLEDPADQASLPFPRFGFFGVVDERFDLELLAAVATKKPEWQFIIVGPVVKIDPTSLPVRSNIHYLGMKSYDELPAYLSNWQIAFLPFALNEATRYISPTKTPEYLAAGKPVLSTPIRDVVRTYGAAGLVHIVDSPTAFIEAAEKLLTAPDLQWLGDVDRYLESMSWDNLVLQIHMYIQKILQPHHIIA